MYDNFIVSKYVMYKIILESRTTYSESMVTAIYFDIYMMSYRNCNVCAKPQKQKRLTRSTNVEMRSGENQRRNPISIRSLNTKLINVSGERHEPGSDNRTNDAIGRRRRGGSDAAVGRVIVGGASIKSHGDKRARREASRAQSAENFIRVNVNKEKSKLHSCAFCGRSTVLVITSALVESDV